MPSPHNATRRRAPAAPKTPDAITLLTEDHKEVKKRFRQYDKLAKDGAAAGEREALAAEICTMLKVHTQIEEEILYPSAREALPEPDLIDEAVVEHASAKDLIAQIEGMSGGDDLYDAKVKVLGEFIDHHVKEEQEEMFPKLRRRIDIKAVGERLQQRKQELMAEQDALH
jgi:hypothetical protein